MATIDPAPDSENWPRRAVIFGATGGIGAALCRLLADRGVRVLAGSRSGEAPRHERIAPFRFDLDDESSIARAAAGLTTDEPVDLAIVATGVLTLQDGTGPERSASGIDPSTMERVLRTNTIGPALIAKHVLPVLPREGRGVFAVLSAKVGSIGDNRLGGWHSYRASKAALNMLVRNFAVEMRRTHPHSVVLALHPGTVDTALSKPFQANLPEGQLRQRRDAARQLLDVLRFAGPEQSGNMLGWDGRVIEP